LRELFRVREGLCSQGSEKYWGKDVKRGGSKGREPQNRRRRSSSGPASLWNKMFWEWGYKEEDEEMEICS